MSTSRIPVIEVWMGEGDIGGSSVHLPPEPSPSLCSVKKKGGGLFNHPQDYIVVDLVSKYVHLMLSSVFPSLKTLSYVGWW